MNESNQFCLYLKKTVLDYCIFIEINVKKLFAKVNHVHSFPVERNVYHISNMTNNDTIFVFFIDSMLFLFSHTPILVR